MTTYKEIFGKYVKNYSSDPSSDAEGQIWYNRTSGTFKSVVASGSWSSSSPLITAKEGSRGVSNGTTDANLSSGGYDGSVYMTQTLEYNGSGWSTGGSLPTAKALAAPAGTQTAALLSAGVGPGGSNVNTSFEYDGSAWTAGGSLNTARNSLAIGGAGIQTAALVFGGGAAPGLTGATEQYDGTSWISVPPMATARRELGGAGTQTSALAFGGTAPGASAATEEWSGPQTTATASTLTTS